VPEPTSIALLSVGAVALIGVATRTNGVLRLLKALRHEVPNVEANAKRLGGQVLIAPRSGLFDGKVAVIADPTGAAIGLLEWSDELLKGAR